jgi:hypothetical protein
LVRAPERSWSAFVVLTVLYMRSFLSWKQQIAWCSPWAINFLTWQKNMFVCLSSCRGWKGQGRSRELVIYIWETISRSQGHYIHYFTQWSKQHCDSSYNLSFADEKTDSVRYRNNKSHKAGTLQKQDLNFCSLFCSMIPLLS